MHVWSTRPQWINWAIIGFNNIFFFHLGVNPISIPVMNNRHGKLCRKSSFIPEDTMTLYCVIQPPNLDHTVKMFDKWKNSISLPLQSVVALNAFMSMVMNGFIQRFIFRVQRCKDLSPFTVLSVWHIGTCWYWFIYIAIYWNVIVLLSGLSANIRIYFKNVWVVGVDVIARWDGDFQFRWASWISYYVTSMHVTGNPRRGQEPEVAPRATESPPLLLARNISYLVWCTYFL